MYLRNSCMPETGGWWASGRGAWGSVQGRLSPASLGRIGSLCWRMFCCSLTVQVDRGRTNGGGDPCPVT